MALTVTAVGAPNQNPQASLGIYKVNLFDVTFDSSYATGGEALTAADLGLTAVVLVISDPYAKTSSGSTAVGVRYDYTNSKLLAYYATANASNVAFAEATASDNLSTFSVRVMAVGV